MLRSLLFVPGHMPNRFEKALASAADAVIVDLEDAVDPNRKQEARDAVAGFFSLPGAARRFVRINGLDTGDWLADLEAIIAPGLHGVVLPKFQAGEDVRKLDWVMSQLEARAGLDDRGIEILPLVETGVGVVGLGALDLPLPRVRQFTFGMVDLKQDLGLDVDEEETQLAHIRWSLASASRAAGLEPPIDTVFVAIRDADGFTASARRARAFGSAGKLCIHPDQVGLANAAFMPSENEIVKARAILAAFDANPDLGAFQVDGTMVDKPVIAWARGVMATSLQS